MWNLWNVALEICTLCWKDIFKLERKVNSWNICDDCIKHQKEWVNLVCETCWAYHCVKVSAFNWQLEAGSRWKVYKCMSCNDWQIMWHSPEEE